MGILTNIDRAAISAELLKRAVARGGVRRLLLACVILVQSVFAGAVMAASESLVLKVPAHSRDGSYVLRIDGGEAAFQAERQGRRIEVYRNKDGGSYQRIMAGPKCTALSELVRENGVYGYKARWVSTKGEVVSAYTSEVFVEVASQVPRLMPRRDERLAAGGI